MLEFLSIIAFRFAIFSVIYLNARGDTVHSVARGSHLQIVVGSKYQGYSRRHAGRVRSSSAPHQSCGSCFLPFLDGVGGTDAEDVLGLLLYLLEDVGLFLLEEVFHLA